MIEKIRILGENSKYDICASTASSRSEKFPSLYKSDNDWIGATASAGICHSYTPDGRCVSLFKTLYTNKCIYNCKYCFSQTCKQRVSFTPEEYARTFMKLYSMNVVEGVFISSGICGDADETTKEMLEVIKLLRFKYHFRGYVHFKCLPRVSSYLIKEAVALSDRISINLEASTKSHLNEIAEQKSFDSDIITRQRWLKEIRIHHNKQAEKILHDLQSDHPQLQKPILSQNNTDQLRKENNQKNINNKIIISPEETLQLNNRLDQRNNNGYKKYRWDEAPILNSGHTTQLVIGAATGETDFDLLKRIDWEYREMDLTRGYFSAFTPIEGTPLENVKAAPLEREHRLYQTDWLMRIYHYKIKEIKDILNTNENLPQGDPKVHLARLYFGKTDFIDPNEASYHELLRVPGIGPTSAKRIINLRAKNHQITTRSMLQNVGVVLKRADPFLKINGNHQQTLTKYI